MVGVLALQGDYSKHVQILEMLNLEVLEVRYPNDLSLIDGLVIPGGESTTISDLMTRVSFHEAIKIFAKKKTNPWYMCWINFDVKKYFRRPCNTFRSIRYLC